VDSELKQNRPIRIGVNWDQNLSRLEWQKDARCIKYVIQKSLTQSTDTKQKLRRTKNIFRCFRCHTFFHTKYCLWSVKDHTSDSFLLMSDLSPQISLVFPDSPDMLVRMAHLTVAYPSPVLKRHIGRLLRIPIFIFSNIHPTSTECVSFCFLRSESVCLSDVDEWNAGFLTQPQIDSLGLVLDEITDQVSLRGQNYAWFYCTIMD